MDKKYRKQIEQQLAMSMAYLLKQTDEKAAAKVEKAIRSAAKDVAKKFVKHKLAAVAEAKKQAESAKKKEAAKEKKATAKKPVKAAKKVSAKKSSPKKQRRKEPLKSNSDFL